MSCKQEFTTYVTDCFHKRQTVQLSDVIEKDSILTESQTVVRVEDLQRMWKARLRTFYDLCLNKSQSTDIPSFDLNVSEQTWTSIFSRVVQNQDEINQSISRSGRLAAISALYRQ